MKAIEIWGYEKANDFMSKHDVISFDYFPILNESFANGVCVLYIIIYKE
jgi:hypothetical protein